MFDAQLCAVQQTTECILDTWRPPQTGEPPFPPPAPPTIFTNQQQFCEVLCPDGSTFGAIIAAGKVSALSQAQANLTAASLACQRARQLRICIGTSSPLTAACVSTAYSLQLKARGGTPWVVTFDDLLLVPFCANLGDRFPYTWTVISGSLPDGINLGECSGVLSGTPTAAGTYIFTIRATDAIGSFQTKQFSLTVGQITTASPLTSGSVGSAYTQNLAVSPSHDQETEFWTIASGALPPGITMSTAGVLSGTPTLEGTYQFTPHVVFTLDGANVTCEKQFTLEINEVSTPTFYWTLDSTLIDSVAAKALAVGVTTYGTGIINNGFRFALSGQPRALETASDLSYTTGRHISIAFWINWSVAPDANDNIIVKFDDGNTNDPPSITVDWSTILGVLNVGLAVATLTEDSTVQTPFTPTLGQWYFFTVVYDADTGIAVLYRDTVPILTTTPIFLPSVTTNRIAFWSSSLVLTADYVVDETAWWFNHKLTASEITFLYNSGAANRPPGI
jgi:hypothetical protein